MQRDYSKLPARVSSIAGEIENKRVLQTEQIRQANLSMEYLLYYLSGGNEKPGFVIKDKVRAEDQDLRGWFSEQYGSDYIETFLVNHLQFSSKSNPVRVAEIKTAFEANPYGYVLRTGAVNDYHLGRIITHAKNVYLAREEAKKYSKELAIMCAKLLLSGEPPNNNIFTIMHSSIRSWYKIQGNNSYNLHFEEHIAKSSLTNPNKGHNHCTYLAQVICALFDMHSYSQPADSWVVDPQIVTIIDELDGVSNSSIVSNQEGVSKHQATIEKFTPLIADAESKGWNVKPTYTQALRTMWTSWPTPALPEVQAKIDAWTTAEENGLKIGDELPKGLPLEGQPNPINTTNRYWWNYDSWSSMVATKADAEAKLTTLSTGLTTLQEQDVALADRHRVPIMELISLASGSIYAYQPKPKLIKHVYDTVKQIYGLNYIQTPYKIRGATQSVFPQLIVPTQYGQTVQPLIRNNWETVHLGGIDISKTTLFYAKALLGVNATAYWSNTLSHRLVFRPVPALDYNQHVGGDIIPPHTKVYLYSANMKTGGIKNEYTLIAEIAGNKEASSVQVGAFLPDTPLYTPGTNVQLSNVLNNSFSDKVAADNTLQQWLRSPTKSQFSYAYVIKSAWDPAVNKSRTDPNDDTKIYYWQDRNAPSYLFGTRGRAGKVSSTNPAVRNGHVEWLTATTYAKQNYKGVTTFAPNLETVRYDPWGNRASAPEFYEARGALSATTMSCVALPKSTSEKILGFMKSVPAKIEELLNRVNNRPNTPWYDAKNTISHEAIFGDFTRMSTEWPEFRYAGGRWSQADFDSALDPMRTFLLNRTEALFLDDIAALVNKAHTSLKQNKGGKLRVKPNSRPRAFFMYLNDAVSGYDLADFGDTYQEYMALLGALAYLNSYEMLTDTPQYRNYADWAKPFRGRIDSILNPLLAGVTPQKIYEDTINDTEDVVNIHKTLSALGAFQDMVELPVFDVEEFNIKWKKLGAEEGAITSSPFDSDGFVDVGLGGLKAGAYKGLAGGYGDVFHDTIMSTSVLRPVIKHNLSNEYVYSSLRIPVNTRGVSSKVYGMRPGTSLAFTTGANVPSSGMNLAVGSSGITYPKMAGAAGVVFAGVLGMAMWKNISSETAFSDKRFRIDDSD